MSLEEQKTTPQPDATSASQISKCPHFWLISAYIFQWLFPGWRGARHWEPAANSLGSCADSIRILFYFLPILFSAASCSSSQYLDASPPTVPVKPLANVSLEKAVDPSDPGASIVVSESSLGSLIRTYNPNLRAARKLIIEASARLQAAGLRSNPSVEIEFQTSTDFEPFLTAGISRRFQRTNRLVLEKRVSAPLVDAARAEVRDVERLLIGEARKQLISVKFQGAKMEILREQKENADKLATFIAESAARGELSLLEVPTAEIEAQRLSTQIEQTKIKRELAIAKLKPLLGLTPTSSVKIGMTLLPADLPLLQASVPENRPDLVAARFTAQSASENIALARASGIPDYQLGVFAGLGLEDDAPEGHESQGIIGVRFSMPLGKDPRTPGVVREAHAQRSRLDLTTAALRKTILAEIRAAHSEMAAWEKLIQRIQSELMPKATKNTSQVRAAYDKGQVPLQDVLRAREQELALRLSELEATKSFHEARARYLTATAN